MQPVADFAAAQRAAVPLRAEAAGRAVHHLRRVFRVHLLPRRVADSGPLPLDVSISSPLAGTDLLLCALFGGLISGVGSGLAIRGGGAMDGMEVMAVIFARKLGMTVGTFVMSYNVVLYILAGLLRSSWILPCIPLSPTPSG